MLKKWQRYSVFRGYGWLAALLYSVAFVSIAGSPNPEPLPAAQGRVILTLTGNIAVGNSEPSNSAIQSGELKAEFDLAMLDALEQHEFTTNTPWTQGAHHFQGVLLKDLLQRVGAQGHLVKAMAFNEYFVEVDIQQPELEKLLITTRLDGEVMRIRDKGPTWLMLPLSDLQQLDNKRYHELLIWQLKNLDVQ